jgi:hypothetical protein
MNELYIICIFLGAVGIVAWVLPYGWGILGPVFSSKTTAPPRYLVVVLRIFGSLLVVFSVTVSGFAVTTLQPDERGIPVTVRNLHYENISYVSLLFPGEDTVASSVKDLKKRIQK